MADQKRKEPEPPRDELIARFQLDTERAIAGLRDHTQRQLEKLTTQVAALHDSVNRMTHDVNRNTEQLEGAVRATRVRADECNLALKEAVKSANAAADSARVFEMLRAEQPDFRRAVAELEQRLAAVKDDNDRLHGALNALTTRLDDLEIVADSFEETAGEVRGLDLAVKSLNTITRTQRS